MVQNRDTQSNFIFGDYKGNYVSDQAAAEYGNADKTFRYASTIAKPFCFNQTKYFVRNGTTLQNCRSLSK
jgi:hypothetical protein